MPDPLLIYADVCCLNRPLDEQQQSRVRLETEAMLTILHQCETSNWTLVSSDALRYEIARNADSSKKEQLEAMLSLAKIHISSSEIESEAETLM